MGENKIKGKGGQDGGGQVNLLKTKELNTGVYRKI